jgi:hypothetical protein
MLRARGHEVRVAIRLNDQVAQWAEGIVRFAPHPGPPSREEARWYHAWLDQEPERWLIYVVRDFDGAAEYWKQVLEGLSPEDDPGRRKEAEKLRDDAAGWADHLPSKPAEAAERATWFGTGKPFIPPRAVTKLSGPWVRGIDPERANLTVHEPLEAPGSYVMLAGDKQPIALGRTLYSGGRWLAIANGAFLLNEAMVNPARRGLARRVLDWAGDEPNHVALVEGSFVLGGLEATPSLFALLKRLPVLRWVAIQLGLAGLLAALARAPRLGRPRAEPPSDSDRPAAHAEALGALLARVGDHQTARGLIESYRQWRHPRAAIAPPRTTGRAQPRLGRPAAPAPAPAAAPESGIVIIGTIPASASSTDAPTI